MEGGLTSQGRLNKGLNRNRKGNVVLDPTEAKVRAVAEIVSALVQGVKKGVDVDLNLVKREVSLKYSLSKSPKLVEIIAALPEEHRAVLLPQLRAKPVRTASGIAVVAVMSKPHRCPHIATTGNICVYCPGGPDSDFEYSTQSYTGYEPTSMRAIRARYNPYVQARARVDQLRRLGHSVDKVEFILMGGTFMSLPTDYRDYFVRNLHDALSGHSSSDVDEAVRYSEQSRTKCIGLTIETRPDFCLTPHLTQMLSYGCTRLEIGLQSIYEDVARDTNRGHTVAAVAECFQLAKNAGFKVIAHMMPDLPNVGWERDMESFREFFENPAFRTDGLKVYPTLVIRGTGLYELWKKGIYKNYHPEKLVDLVARILALVPPWVRIYRIQRDIPMPLVTSGVEKGNLRELALARMGHLGLKCRDVRTRECGIQDIHHKVRPEEVELVRRDYTANGGCCCPASPNLPSSRASSSGLFSSRPYRRDKKYCRSPSTSMGISASRSITARTCGSTPCNGGTTSSRGTSLFSRCPQKSSTLNLAAVGWPWGSLSSASSPTYRLL